LGTGFWANFWGQAFEYRLFVADLLWQICFVKFWRRFWRRFWGQVLRNIWAGFGFWGQAFGYRFLGAGFWGQAFEYRLFVTGFLRQVLEQGLTQFWGQVLGNFGQAPLPPSLSSFSSSHQFFLSLSLSLPFPLSCIQRTYVLHAINMQFLCSTYIYMSNMRSSTCIYSFII